MANSSVSDNPALISVQNPARPDETLGSIAPSSSLEIQSAVSKAREAQKSWSKLTGTARATILNKWAQVIDDDQHEFAQLICQEVGKPIGEARGETARASAILRYFAVEAVQESGQVIPSSVGQSLQLKIEKPLGVAGLITPWNFPIAIPLWKAAPALAFGNGVVIKPSELSSLVAEKLQKSAAVAGLPEGIYETVYGAGSVGQTLLESEIDLISFTGSAITGAKVIQTAAARQIRCQAEMGGKNPSIVLADADLDLAATMVAGAAMRFAGQKCTATSRVIVEKSIAAAFTEKLKAAIEKLPVGNPAEASTAVGPVISQSSQTRILDFLAQVKDDCVYRGQAPTEGWYVAPHVFRCSNPTSPLAQKELFGPVLAILEVEDFEEAIQVANSVEYGLSASLFTSNLQRAMKYVDQIEAGMVRVNADTTGVDPYAPFGGVKKSSYGWREQGPAARQFFTETSTVQINYGG